MRLIRVHDPAMRLARTLATYNNPQHGVLALTANHGPKRLEDFCDMLLTALGKPSGIARGAKRGSSRKLELVEAWLCGERIRTVIVGAAGRLGPHLGRFIEVAHILDLDIYFISGSSDVTRRARERFDESGGTEQTVHAFLSRFQPRTEPAHEPAPSSCPTPPEARAGLGRLAAQTALSRQEFIAYDALWRAGYDLAAHALKPPATDEDAMLVLQHLIVSADSPNEALARLQGAQAALLVPGGYLMRVEQPHRTIVFSGDTNDSAGSLNARASALRSYIHPNYAAAGALKLATRAQADALADVRIGDLAVDGATVHIAERDVTVPTPLRGILRAQLALRALEGHDTADALFHTDQGVATAAGIQRWLALIAKETGVPVTDTYNYRSTPTGKQWLRKAGVSLVALDPCQRQNA